MMEGYSVSGVNKESTLLPAYLAFKDMFKSSEARPENSYLTCFAVNISS